MPTFNGLAMFGIGTKEFVDERPRRLRRVKVANVDGYRIDDLGSEGAEIRVTGTYFGFNEVALGEYENALEAIRIAGIPYEYVDSHGVTHWPVFLTGWRRTSQGRCDATTARAFRDYEFTLERNL